MSGRLRWSLLLGCSALALVCAPGSTALLVHAFEGPYPALRGGESLARKPDVALSQSALISEAGVLGGAETLVASGLHVFVASGH